MIFYFILFIYFVCLLFIFVFSLAQLHLALVYLRSLQKKKAMHTPVLQLDTAPVVTVQLPVYNERYVAERLLNAVARLQYFSGKLQVQVLDDSSDETVQIIAQKVKELRKKGLDITHVRRTSRTGFKAGALQYGLGQARGEFIAIFDADFLPEKDFLLKTLPHFSNERYGVVQARWGHINQWFSLLTRLQAFGLDAHFTIEQTGRNRANSFINFNGTAGVWRKSCIEDAGGWHYDTLTEDLDLSYRAQLKGWQFIYLEDVVAPAELPVLMPAIKSQQYRWNKGAAESARKHLFSVLKAPVKLVNKIHAVFHLLNSSVFLFLLLGAVFSVPALFIKKQLPQTAIFIDAGSVFVIGFLGTGFFYWIAARQTVPEKTWRYFLLHYPAFLVISMGLSLHNGLAVLEGWLGFKTPFVRTPKFNIQGLKGSWKGNVYINQKITWVNIAEALLAIYFTGGLVAGFMLKDGGLLLFHAMLATGFASIFVLSVSLPGQR